MEVPPELLARMHARSVAYSRVWDLEVTNDPSLEPDAIVAAFTQLLSAR